MTDVHRTIIVPASIVQQARDLAASASPGGVGMFVSPLSPDGTEPASHFISSGLIDETLASWLDSPEALAENAPLTLTEAEDMLAACDVSADDWRTAIERVGVVQVSSDEA